MADTTNAATGGQASEPLSAARIEAIRAYHDAVIKDPLMGKRTVTSRLWQFIDDLLAEVDRLHAALAAAEAERAQWREIGRAVAAAYQPTQYSYSAVPSRIVTKARALLASAAAAAQSEA